MFRRQTAEETAPAFLSSMTWEFAPALGGREDLKRLRRRAYEAHQGSLWVAECDEPELAHQTPLRIADTLLARVKASSGFICLLAGRRRGEHEHGSPIEIIERRCAVSYFESELVFAALTNKPVTVLATRDFDPGPRLAALLELLRESLPPSEWRSGLDESGVLREIAAAISRYRKTPRRKAARQAKKTKGLALAHKYQAAMRAGQARGKREVLFLGGVGEPRGASRPDRELVRYLLDEVDRSPEAEVRLGRIWMAIRELMVTPVSAERSVELLALWNEALGLWTRASAWYGLHGHIDLGVVASTFSTARVREGLRASNAKLSPEAVSHPGSAIASALFSVAKWMPSNSLRREVLEDGMVHLRRSFDDQAQPTVGLELMAASYQWALNGVGTSLPHFREALAIAERQQQNPGVAHSELGAALLRTGRLREGLAHLKQGVNVLEQLGDGETPELARALKKLTLGSALCARPGSAYATLKRLRALVAKRGYHDQAL